MPAINRQLARQRITELGASDRQAARAVGCSASHLREVLAGNRKPSIELASRLARLIQVPLRSLLSDPVAQASALRRLRRAAGIKPGDFAARLGISAQHLRGIEGGWKSASPEVLGKAAAELGCEVTDIAPQQDAA